MKRFLLPCWVRLYKRPRPSLIFSHIHHQVVPLNYAPWCLLELYQTHNKQQSCLFIEFIQFVSTSESPSLEEEGEGGVSAQSMEEVEELANNQNYQARNIE